MGPDPSRLRDSTQIVLPCADLSGIREELTERYTVSVVTVGDVDGEGYCRIIGSPVEIKGAGDFLARNGVALP